MKVNKVSSQDTIRNKVSWCIHYQVSRLVFEKVEWNITCKIQINTNDKIPVRNQIQIQIEKEISK